MSNYQINDAGNIELPSGEVVRLAGTKKRPLSSRERALRDFVETQELPPEGSTNRLIVCTAFGITDGEQEAYTVDVPLEALEDVDDLLEHEEG